MFPRSLLVTLVYIVCVCFLRSLSAFPFFREEYDEEELGGRKKGGEFKYKGW
jgi:hypothetical protein